MLDFGFGFWVLFFVIFLGCGRMCGWGARRYRHRRRELESGCGCGPGARQSGDRRSEREAYRREDEHRLSNLEARVKKLGERQRDRLPRPAAMSEPTAREREPEPVVRKATSRLQELQQKFVDGRLTLQEYERELDRLERLD
ncbi:MAG: hypothetical protein JSU87_07270 [Gemmatimonadota bacterium]|nr:MAG: hypothetical protein JSU87_07270 [Gemmatimonadota bacterium]